MINTNKKNFFLFLLVLIIGISSCSQNNAKNVFSLAGTTMGTTYSIKIVLDSDKNITDNFDKKVDSILVEVNRQMSTYQKDSELSEFNISQDTTWFSVSEDLAVVMNASLEIAKRTSGAFDVTVGPLVNLWGFGPIDKLNYIPSDREIKETMHNTGVKNLNVDLESLAIKKANPNIYCDLSGIAKGFGVDKVSIFMEDLGFVDYMVEIGGEVRTKGFNKNGEEWKIGISSPTNNNLQEVIRISDFAMATSGDYLNYFEKEGVRYSHTIDPITGKPITHKLASVTVFYKDCRTADALATAISVMGPTVGYNFALEKKLPIFMIVRVGDSFIEKKTPEFENYIIKERE